MIVNLQGIVATYSDFTITCVLVLSSIGSADGETHKFTRQVNKSACHVQHIKKQQNGRTSPVSCTTSRTAPKGKDFTAFPARVTDTR